MRGRHLHTVKYTYQAQNASTDAWKIIFYIAISTGICINSRHLIKFAQPLKQLETV